MAKNAKASGKVRAIKLGGDLRIGAAKDAFEALRGAAAKPEKQVALDARDVEKIDAAGLQALLAGRSALAKAGKAVSWTGVSPQLCAAAGLLGLSETLELPR